MMSRRTLTILMWVSGTACLFNLANFLRTLFTTGTFHWGDFLWTTGMLLATLAYIQMRKRVPK
ncbi:hypothetical protein [Priestia taiwanensis]|uniref:Uncharacterized protein n=1 Tax=Priestia taiwanensis TaxID=1347902 RepID=A0A917AVL5_9BACI|nr:hypothetical protein [Priestia taiwanensis]MBM7364693.1 hypothetical protein [Priestia taiwanensis]GGE78924.1 hypothetical protein GCM10007140_30580 [Priestia taiwanensis]